MLIIGICSHQSVQELVPYYQLKTKKSLSPKFQEKGPLYLAWKSVNLEKAKKKRQIDWQKSIFLENAKNGGGFYSPTFVYTCEGMS